MKIIRVFFILFILSQTLVSQSVAYDKIETTAFVRETMVNNGSTGKVLMAWYIPVEMWRIVFSQSKALTSEQSEQFISAVSRYSIFAVIDGKLNTSTSLDYRSYEEIRSSLKLVKDGKTFLPLKDEQLDPMVQQFLSIFKPTLMGMMGNMGENMNFYVFDDAIDGKRLLDPFKAGSFTISENGNNFSFKLPLGTLLPAKECPQDGEKMNGAWEFCPYHGNRLVEGKK